MSDMRHLINLFEALSAPLDIDDEETLAMDPDDDESMGKNLQGAIYLSSESVAQFFPSVKDRTVFNRAWRKVMTNKEEILNRYELWELGRAFIDMIRMDRSEKMDLLHKLIVIHMPPGSEDEPVDIMDR